MNSSDILIIGGGFGGIQTALNLHRSLPKDKTITLVTSHPVFEFYPALHSFLSHQPETYVYIPLSDIFDGTRVKVVIDTAVSLGADGGVVGASGSVYQGAYIVWALGSQAEFFGIEGLQELSFGFRSIGEAEKIKAHLTETFEKYLHMTDPVEQVVAFHFVVVGGGPAGVDVAGELAAYVGELAKQHSVPPGVITIDLIETAPRILPMMPESVSRLADRHARSLGVNIFTDRILHKQGSWTVSLQDMNIGAKTLVWTAGVRAHDFFEKNGFVLGKKKRVVVDQHLAIPGKGNVFIVGDCADTQYSGLAQTAVSDGEYVAKHISQLIAGKDSKPYEPQSKGYILGVGPGWSILVSGKLILSGRWVSWLRRVVDFKFFVSILGFTKAFKLFFLKK